MIIESLLLAVLLFESRLPVALLPIVVAWILHFGSKPVCISAVSMPTSHC